MNLYVTPPPHLISWHRTPSTWMLPTPANLHPPPLALCPVLCACIFFRILHPFAPFFLLSACSQVPVGPWGLTCCGSIRASVYCLPPHVIHRFPSYFLTWFLCVSILCKDKGARRIHFLEFARPGPLSPCYMSTSALLPTPLSTV